MPELFADPHEEVPVSRLQPPQPPQSTRAVVVAVVLVVVALVVGAAVMGVRQVVRAVTTDVTPGPNDSVDGLRVQTELREAGAVAVAQHGRSGSYPMTTAALTAAGYSPDPAVAVTVGPAGKNAPYEFCVQGLADGNIEDGILYSFYVSPTRPSKLIPGACSS